MGCHVFGLLQNQINDEDSLRKLVNMVTIIYSSLFYLLCVICNWILWENEGHLTDKIKWWVTYEYVGHCKMNVCRILSEVLFFKKEAVAGFLNYFLMVKLIKKGNIPWYLPDVQNDTVCYYAFPASDAIRLLNSACILKWNGLFLNLKITPGVQWMKYFCLWKIQKYTQQPSR